MTRWLLLLALLAVGCADDAPGTRSSRADTDETTQFQARPDSIAAGFVVRGVYLGPAYDSAAAVVNHEAIPGFMGAMRMPIRVADRAELRGLSAGDKIRFRLADPEGNGYRASELQTLPPETPLALADTTEEAVPVEASLPSAPDPEEAGAP